MMSQQKSSIEKNEKKLRESGLGHRRGHRMSVAVPHTAPSEKFHHYWDVSSFVRFTWESARFHAKNAQKSMIEPKWAKKSTGETARTAKLGPHAKN